MATPKLIFFDAGGTLFEPREAVGETYARLALRYEHRADAASLQAGFIRCFRAQPPLAFSGFGSSIELERLEYEWWRRLVFEVMAADDFPRFEEFFAAAFAHYRAPEAWRLFDDVRPTLQALNELGVRCAVLSNFDSRLHDLLRGFALADQFAGVHFSAQLGVAKPDVRIFEAALHFHGLRPAEAWHVGDSVREDFEGALNAGLGAWLIARQATGAGIRPAQLTRLDQLIGLVQQSRA
ncbi:MAG: HAD-IA family hydrolase [Acidobacteria bacterium]|nr:HAD-IA family hydrolase [Acidobacteriota bacterium]MBI3426149.1 HAD-IA family hydrolase [Acidobacteriota bacterium]